MGLENIIKQVKIVKLPSEQQDWNPTNDDLNNGITRSNLMKHFGFNSSAELESAAKLNNVDADKYLEELSGWSLQPVKPGSSRTRLKAPSK